MKRIYLKLCIFILSVLLLVTVSEVGSVRAVTPSAQVFSVNHPDQVLPGQIFQVIVTVNYSDKYLADVGIWDPQVGEMLQSVTLISSLTGPGKTSFTFDLTAPAGLSEWNLTAVTRIWWQDGWYQDPNRGNMPFQISISNRPDRVTLTIVSQAGNSSVAVDGSEYQIYSDQPLSLQLQVGMHTLEAMNIIQVQEGTRYVFSGWSDGVASNPRQILLTKDQTVTATYRTQYYLSVFSGGRGRVTGTGWYDEGQQAGFGAEPAYATTSWLGLMTSEYQFKEWSGDSNSTDQASSLLMTQPMSVTAQWVHSSTKLDLSFIAGILLVASLPLTARGLLRGARRRRIQISLKGERMLMAFVLLFLVFFTAALVPIARAQPLLTFTPRVSIVKIGDAQWYYWNQTNSDTCILWLGGGISQQTTIGYNYYWINPFDYESFGTIHFIQDLARYYCVIALEQGADNSPISIPNRTIYQELYQIQSPIISQVHNWIKMQGYAHTFLTGYSVGGQAAALEVALRDPQGWTSSDGLILITVPLVDSDIAHAQNIRTNLLFLYGGNLPDFVVTGQKFYDNAPSEGWKGTYYNHKEFHILQDVGHELWTVRDTGAYYPEAANLVVSFIEKSKALQFQPETTFTGQLQNSSSAIRFTSVTAPRTVQLNQTFLVEAVLSQQPQTESNTTLVIYDDRHGQPISTATYRPLNPTGAVRLVMPAISNSSQQSYSVFILQNESNRWVSVGDPYRFEVTISDLVNLTIETSVSNTQILFDNVEYVVPPNGSLQFETARGFHSIQLQPIIQLSNTSRLLFTEWQDQNTSLQRQIMVNNDTVLNAIYRKQYFVTVNSTYGTPGGSGWYDANSTATITVDPPILNQAQVVFANWTGDSNDAHPQMMLFVDGPKTVEATWDPINEASQTYPPLTLTLLALSAILFAVLLSWNITGNEQSEAGEDSKTWPES